MICHWKGIVYYELPEIAAFNLVHENHPDLANQKGVINARFHLSSLCRPSRNYYSHHTLLSSDCLTHILTSYNWKIFNSLEACKNHFTLQQCSNQSHEYHFSKSHFLHYLQSYIYTHTHIYGRVYMGWVES